MKIEHSVVGSSGNEYTVIIDVADNVSVSCNCAAGVYNKKCKHKDIVIEYILNDQIHDLPSSVFMEQELYYKYIELKEGEKTLENAKRNMKRLTSAFEKSMVG